MAEIVTLFQILYKEDQRAHLYPFAVPYFNENLTIFFENDPIKRIVDAYEGEKLSVCSWKLSQKVRRVHPVTEEVLKSDYQVLSLTRNSSRHQMLAMANQWHKEFIPTIDLLWQKLGLKRPPEAKNPIYQNHFSAKSEIYKDYVTNFLTPAMELIMTDEELNAKMLQPSGYGKMARGADLKSVKAKLGLEDYPLCPFILERCPSLFFQMKGYKISYIP
jgi:hypothetical protein